MSILNKHIAEAQIMTTLRFWNHLAKSFTLEMVKDSIVFTKPVL